MIMALTLGCQDSLYFAILTLPSDPCPRPVRGMTHLVKEGGEPDLITRDSRVNCRIKWPRTCRIQWPRTIVASNDRGHVGLGWQDMAMGMASPAQTSSQPKISHFRHCTKKVHMSYNFPNMASNTIMPMDKL